VKSDSHLACVERENVGYGKFVDTAVDIPSWKLLVKARTNAEHVSRKSSGGQAECCTTDLGGSGTGRYASLRARGLWPNGLIGSISRLAAS
jgi:hypothetical protein